jgi:hypothetical protein
MDWRLDRQAHQWKVTSGAWRAIVVQLHTTEWYLYVERMGPPHDRYDGPSCEAALEGRAWCQSKIAALKGHNDKYLDTRGALIRGDTAAEL